jgi:hypothetical protein
MLRSDDQNAYYILNNSLKPKPDKDKNILKMLTVCQHPDLFLPHTDFHISQRG